MVYRFFFHGFFKELDFKELEIHRYSLLDIDQWISMDFHQWIHWWSINEYGPLSLGPFFGARTNWDRDMELSGQGHGLFMVLYGFSLFFFHGFFKELDFKELEIHRYSLLDIHQWLTMDIHRYSLMDIHEFIDGHPSMNMVPFFWAPFFGPFFGPHGAAFWAPWGPGPWPWPSTTRPARFRDRQPAKGRIAKRWVRHR